MNRKEVQDSVPELPEGWEFTGEFRLTKNWRTEWAWHPHDKRPVEWSNSQYPVWILKRIQPDHDKLRREEVFKQMSKFALNAMNGQQLIGYERILDDIEAAFREHPMGKDSQ